MLEKQKLVVIYEKIQKALFYMIPEKWDKICLYSSIIEQVNGLQTGEMFFYYYPKSILKKNPINVYEVPIKFNIEESHYMRLADNLYYLIKELRIEFAKAGQKLWSNVTIVISDAKFKVEYHYEDLLNTNYSSFDRHLIWKYKYLNVPIEVFAKKDRNMIETYIEELPYQNDKIKVDTISMYQKNVHNVIEFDKKEVEVQKESVKVAKTKKVKQTREYGEYQKEEKIYGKYEHKKTLQDKIIEKYGKGAEEETKEPIKAPPKKNQILNF